MIHPAGPVTMPKENLLKHWLSFSLLAFVFGISFTLDHLYADDQNQYFLHGLAKSGFGLLRADWLATTADPTPVFSFLVKETYHYLGQHMFYVFCILMLGVYAYSLLGIASSLFSIDSSRSKYLAYLALITMLHAPIFERLSANILGVSVGRHLLFTEGVAFQALLTNYLEPSTFGVLLLLSIHLFLRGKLLLAVASSSLAAVFHPAYVLSAGILTVSYMITLVRRGESLKRALGVGLCALGVILPMFVYAYVAFRPTSLDVWRDSQAILVHFRIPDHAVFEKWFGAPVFIKVAIILLAMYTIRRTELFLPMLLSVVVAASLTVVQVLSGNHTLALLFPWRLSVFLVPLSSAIILANVIAKPLAWLEREIPWSQNVLVELSIAMLGVLVGAGAVTMAQQFRSSPADGRGALMTFVRATKSPGDTYLVPVPAGPENLGLFENFRLGARAPVFVDFKSIPYKDTEVVEWYKRVRLAHAFYEVDGAARCRMLGESLANYKITHVVLRVEAPGGCSDWKSLYKDESYELVMVKPSSGEQFCHSRTVGEAQHTRDLLLNHSLCFVRSHAQGRLREAARAIPKRCADRGACDLER